MVIDQPSGNPGPEPDPNGAGAAPASDEYADELPEDLDAVGYVGPYTFPDNSRRRIPGVLYVVIGVALILTALLAGEEAVLINDGFLVCGIGLILFGAYSIAAGWPLRLDETDALVAATQQVGFPVGHASAALGWRGLRSRPTWRILLYSAEEPPDQRGLVLVDAIDGRVLEHFVERNPEDWSDYAEAAEGGAPGDTPAEP
jgi:hypothetical protein